MPINEEWIEKYSRGLAGRILKESNNIFEQEACELGLPENATLEDLHTALQTESSYLLCQIEGQFNQLDELLGINTRPYVLGMGISLRYMNDGLLSKPESQKSADFARAYIVALRGLIKELPAHPVTDNLIQNFFDQAREYFHHQKSLNNANYPTSLNDLLKTNITV